MKELFSLMRELDIKRNFKAKEYLEKKLIAINHFFTEEKLDSAIVGLSGGIDSAVVLSLLVEASKQKDSPIKKIMGIIAPIHGDGITGQSEATEKAQKLCSTLKKSLRAADTLLWATVDLTQAYKSIISESAWTSDAWSKGQMGSVLRTPIFYYHAALLQVQGYKSIVVGTTNKSEGSYIGFFGKYSDNAVDLQLISDLYKSEVYKVANILNIPQEIIERTPKGDVWNSKSDEELMRVDYNFLELYLMAKEYNINPELSYEEQKLWDCKAKLIEEMHYKNLHKYKHGNGTVARINIL